MKMPPIELKYLLRKSASAETSVNPDRWTKENPSYGHCAVFTLIVQDFNGGIIKRVALPKEWEKLGYRSHYYNMIGDKIIDFSKDQFPKEFPYDNVVNGIADDFSDESDQRKHLLSGGNTKKRYLLLSEKLAEILDTNPIFWDKKFQRCWELSFSEKANCTKFRFACLVFDKEKLIAGDVNRSMTEQFGKDRFCSLDGSKCARLSLPHRIDATIGDCGHAPIWCMKKVFDLGYKPSDLPKLDFFEAGFHPDGSPWQRKEPSYSCTYCQNIFAIMGLDKIWGVYEGKWTKFLTEDSFYSSADYALGKKGA